MYKVLLSFGNLIMLLVPDEIPVCYNLPFKIAISLLSKKKKEKKRLFL